MSEKFVGVELVIQEFSAIKWLHGDKKKYQSPKERRAREPGEDEEEEDEEDEELDEIDEEDEEKRDALMEKIKAEIKETEDRIRRKKPVPREIFDIIPLRKESHLPLSGLRAGAPTNVQTAYDIAMDRWDRMLAANPHREITKAAVVFTIREPVEVRVPAEIVNKKERFYEFRARVAKEFGTSVQKLNRNFRLRGVKTGTRDRRYGVFTIQKGKYVAVNVWPLVVLEDIGDFSDWVEREAKKIK